MILSDAISLSSVGHRNSALRRRVIKIPTLSLSGKIFLTFNATSELTFKKVKVSDKGQISIPVDVQREIGIKKGDELLLIRKGRKIVLEKPEKVLGILEDEFLDIQDIAEASMSKIWFRKEEDIWNRYLKGSRK